MPGSPVAPLGCCNLLCSCQADTPWHTPVQAATRRDQCANAVATARQALSAAQGQAQVPAAECSGVSDVKRGSCGEAAAAAAEATAVEGKAGKGTVVAVPPSLARREAELGQLEGQVQQLERSIEAAQQAALAQPMDTAYIALFR